MTEDCQSPGTVIYDQKEYTETVINTDNTKQDITTDKNVVQVTSLDVDDNIEEEYHHICTPIEIPQTIPAATLFEKYVSKRIIACGSKGLKPQYSSLCCIRIEGTVLLDPSQSRHLEGSLVFSQISEGCEINYQIRSGDTELDRAFEIALLDMYLGETSELVLSICKRNGKLRDQSVSPTPYLKCVVKLLKIEDCRNDFNSFLSLFNASEEDKYELALKEKDLGVELFKSQRYIDAFFRFAFGAKLLMTEESFLIADKEHKTEIAHLYSTLCSNMAECHLKEDNPSQAVILCKRALQYDPSNIKSLYRLAAATWALGDVDQANTVLKKLLEVDPNNLAAKQLNHKVQSKIKNYEDEFTKMMKRIFTYQ